MKLSPVKMLREVLESVKVCWRKLRNAELHLFQSLVRRQIVSTFTVIHTFTAICISFKLPNITTIPSQCGMVQQSLTSHSTQYRSFRRRLLPSVQREGGSGGAHTPTSVSLARRWTRRVLFPVIKYYIRFFHQNSSVMGKKCQISRRISKLEQDHAEELKKRPASPSLPPPESLLRNVRPNVLNWPVSFLFPSQKFTPLEVTRSSAGEIAARMLPIFTASLSKCPYAILHQRITNLKNKQTTKKLCFQPCLCVLSVNRITLKKLWIRSYKILWNGWK